MFCGPYFRRFSVVTALCYVSEFLFARILFLGHMLISCVMAMSRLECSQSLSRLVVHVGFLWLTLGCSPIIERSMRLHIILHDAHCSLHK